MGLSFGISRPFSPNTEMKVAIAFVLLFGCVAANSWQRSRFFTKPITSFQWIDDNGVLKTEDLTKSVETFADANDVTIYLYTRSNGNGERLRPASYDLPSNFNAYLQNVFIIHGWNNNYQSNVNTLIKAALLAKDNVNVFAVDWSGPANEGYTTAQAAVAGVGDAVGVYINFLISTYGLSANNFVLYGHSLGAHTAGIAGARVNGQVNFIVGMDPALPLFDGASVWDRLDAGDAQHVQVVHTNAGDLGYWDPCGSSDFYPNGGVDQPGCGVNVSCSHSRSYEYVAESISSGGFTSTQCDGYDWYRDGKCNGNSQSTMGGWWINKSASGIYMLDTNSASPYSQW